MLRMQDFSLPFYKMSKERLLISPTSPNFTPGEKGGKMLKASGTEQPQTYVDRKPTPLPQWWDSHDVMERFHFSERTLQTMREKQLLPYCIVGGRCFYREEDIQALFDNAFERINGKEVMKGGHYYEQL